MLIASQDYALRACALLARRGGAMSSQDIARETSAPRDYLIQLSQPLRNAGIIQSAPGKGGGYRLARPAEEVSALEILEAARKARARRGSGEEGAECAVVERELAAVLEGMTLMDIVNATWRPEKEA